MLVKSRNFESIRSDMGPIFVSFAFLINETQLNITYEKKTVFVLYFTVFAKVYRNVILLYCVKQGTLHPLEPNCSSHSQLAV